MKTCKILVIGRAGQVASSLKEISDDTWEFIGRPDFNVCDQVQLSNIIKEQRPALIINCSAYTAVDKAEVEIDQAYMVNSLAVKNIALECKARNIPLIHISTDYVFDGRKDGYYNEDDEPSPLSIYGKSKLAGEQHIREILQDYVILRTSWVFSQYGTNFVKTMTSLALNKIPIKVIDDQIGCPTAAINLARVIKEISAKMLENNGDVKYGVYNYCDKPSLNWYQFARQIFETLESQGYPYPSLTPISTAEYNAPASRPHRSILDCSLISRNFHVKQYDWLIELENYIRKLI